MGVGVKTYKQLWAILTLLGKEIPYLKYPLPYVEQLVDIHLAWQRKEYKEFRILVDILLEDIMY